MLSVEAKIITSAQVLHPPSFFYIAIKFSFLSYYYR